MTGDHSSAGAMTRRIAMNKYAALYSRPRRNWSTRCRIWATWSEGPIRQMPGQSSFSLPPADCSFWRRPPPRCGSWNSYGGRTRESSASKQPCKPYRTSWMQPGGQFRHHRRRGARMTAPLIVLTVQCAWKPATGQPTGTGHDSGGVAARAGRIESKRKPRPTKRIYHQRL